MTWQRATVPIACIVLLAATVILGLYRIRIATPLRLSTDRHTFTVLRPGTGWTDVPPDTYLNTGAVHHLHWDPRVRAIRFSYVLVDAGRFALRVDSVRSPACLQRFTAGTITLDGRALGRRGPLRMFGRAADARLADDRRLRGRTSAGPGNPHSSATARTTRAVGVDMLWVDAVVLRDAALRALPALDGLAGPRQRQGVDHTPGMPA